MILIQGKKQSQCLSGQSFNNIKRVFIHRLWIVYNLKLPFMQSLGLPYDKNIIAHDFYHAIVETEFQ